MTPQIDILWVAICSALVFIMQAGFLCLESGLTRSKNSINVAIKNLADFCLTTVVFWLFGTMAGLWEITFTVTAGDKTDSIKLVYPKVKKK